MKAIKIDLNGVVGSLDWLPDLAGDDDVTWDAHSLGAAHTNYVDDDALSTESVVVANVGGHRNVSLPAVIVGL